MKKYRALLKYGLGLLCLVALFFFVPARELLEAARNLTAEGIVILLLVSILLIYVSVLKWKLFLERYGEPPSVFWLFHLYLVGYFFNLLFPSFIAGDAYRSYSVGQYLSQYNAAAATVLERYTGFVAMSLLGVVALFFLDGLPLEVELLVLGICFSLILGTAIAVSPKSVQLIPQRWRLRKLVERLREAVQLARSEANLLMLVLVLSFLFHLTAVVNVGLAGAAVGWTDIPWLKLCAVVPVILIIGSVPITPSGLGIQEGAYFYFLTQVGATPAEAFAVALVLRAKGYVLAVFGGIALAISKLQKSQIRESA